MAKNTVELIAQIVDAVFPNEFELIDAQKLQNVLKEIVNSTANKLDVFRSNTIGATGGLQTISFSSDLPTTSYSVFIFDFGGYGIQYIEGSNTVSGFQINSAFPGNGFYIAMIIN
jgi:hypothetical protein